MNCPHDEKGQHKLCEKAVEKPGLLKKVGNVFLIVVTTTRRPHSWLEQSKYAKPNKAIVMSMWGYGVEQDWRGGRVQTVWPLGLL